MHIIRGKKEVLIYREIQVKIQQLFPCSSQLQDGFLKPITTQHNKKFII